MMIAPSSVTLVAFQDERLLHQMQHQLKTAKKKKASGYDVPGMLLFQRISISEFVASDTPALILQKYNEITFADDGSEDRWPPMPLPSGRSPCTSRASAPTRSLCRGDKPPL